MRRAERFNRLYGRGALAHLSPSAATENRAPLPGGGGGDGIPMQRSLRAGSSCVLLGIYSRLALF